MPSIKMLSTCGLPILRMLRLEEALLRTSADNWCLYNDGTSVKAVVMGISGKPQVLIDEPTAKAVGVQVIKRFTGGGTVVVDVNTQFVTFICNETDIPQVPAQPRPLMLWTKEFYAPLFSGFGDFQLQEQDYCFGQIKFGGNAQAITKRRWLHHTSFLWDFEDSSMDLLRMPAKTPNYRAYATLEDAETALQRPHLSTTKTVDL